jgi:hypothetical protein
MMVCKGTCFRHRASKPVHHGRYASGQKRCQGCEIFIKWDGLWYPCCGNRLRLRPRNLTDKKRLALRSKQKNENIEIRQKIPVPLLTE